MSSLHNVGSSSSVNWKSGSTTAETLREHIGVKSFGPSCPPQTKSASGSERTEDSAAGGKRSGDRSRPRGTRRTAGRALAGNEMALMDVLGSIAAMRSELREIVDELNDETS